MCAEDTDRDFFKKVLESDAGHGLFRQGRQRAPVLDPDVLNHVEHWDGGVGAAGVEAGERAVEAGGLVVEQVGQAQPHLAVVVPAGGGAIYNTRRTGAEEKKQKQ